MDYEFIRTSKARFWLLSRWLWKTKGVWLRAGLCWGIGLAFVFVDSSSNYDLRFNLRGSQISDDNIILVTLDEDDWLRFHGDVLNTLSPMRDFQTLTDAFFWNEKTWPRLLKSILADQPKAVGVTLFFTQASINQFDELKQREPVLNNPKIIWAGRVDNDGRTLLPAFANDSNNVGLTDFPQDEDRIVRRFRSDLVQFPHMAVRLAELAGKDVQRMDFVRVNQIINFQGKRGVFKSISSAEILSQRVAKGFFKDKIILIGSKSTDNHLLNSPTGEMSRSEVIAHVTDNILGQKWVAPLNQWLSSFLLLGFLVFSVLILFSYPQSIAFVFLFWFGVGWTAISMWVFDSFYFWLPILAPIVQLSVTYIIFLGYQLSVKENLSWRLEHEKKYLTEVEQLKNNFVSLISHDLKTPIAKIQAICDRLLAKNPEPEVSEGLLALRKESAELHRYIQSILRISRVESSDFKVNKEASDVNELIFKAVDQLQPLAKDKNLSIALDLEPIFLIEIDSVLIFEVILNLVENAIKYTPANGNIRVTSEEVNDTVVVMVEDNGGGISKEEQEKIFEKFYRGSQQIHTKGSGLGLFLVKYFIELHGGKVFLESQVGKGTKVGFTLPIMTQNTVLQMPGASA